MLLNPTWYSLLFGNLWRTGAIALAVLCAALWISANSWQSKAEKAREEVGEVTLKLSTSNASIETLEAEIAKMNQDAIARANAFEREKALAVQEAKRFDRAQAESNKRIERLLAIKGTGCEVPPALMAELEGL